MENSEICKFKIVFNNGYSYKNGLVSAILENRNIYLSIFKITNIWGLHEQGPPELESILFSIARLSYDDELKMQIYNDYPKEFLDEIIEGLKEMGKMSCDSCVHHHKRNLLKHNCSENYIKSKCHE